MSGCLIALDKIPGVRSMGVGETWRRIFAKCVLKVTWPESIHTCKYDQICSGLKARIYGAVHGVKYIWDANSTEENWGFLLVDANNAFNKINQIGMLWTVCHLWSFVARFVLNCYCHHSLIVLRNEDVTANILHIRKGVTQGDLLAMVTHRIGVLPVIKRLIST